MMTSQHFMKLARALSNEFTLYVPDRRGRGLSGPHGDYSLPKEVQDLRAVVEETGAHRLFGLSSGAIVALATALIEPAVHQLALYEPPIPLDGHSSTWVERYEQEIASDNLAAALITVARGTGDSSLVMLLPRFFLTPLLSAAVRADARHVQGDDVPLKNLIPTMHFDQQAVLQSSSLVEQARTLSARVLLLGGAKSQRYLKAALDALQRVLPHAERVELSGLGHLAAENGGKPERVAHALQRFFKQ
jgi:pimeloyl-ACP methyl ester carboxylesterase